jgi:uncharacterized repeat protein (TIGR03803 family)
MSVRLTLVAICGMIFACEAGTAVAADPTPVWSFTGSTDGNQPRGDLIVSEAGVIYGTASSGGINQNGTVFAVSPHTNGTVEQTIYSFTGGHDGSFPSAGLVEDSKGALYGTAARNGRKNAGTVFRLKPPAAGQTAWTEATLWGFTGGTDGAQPTGSLIFDRSGSGVIYGTTNAGGANNHGVVFSLTPPAAHDGKWTEQTLWSFTAGSDGAKPAAALVQDEAGNLYGTASSGGSTGAGVVFELSPNTGSANQWAFSTIWSFSGTSDGATPMGTLVMDSAGALYGTTEFGGGGDCAQPRFPYYPMPESTSEPAYKAAYIPLGGNACGVVFKLTPPSQAGKAWLNSIIWSFQAGLDGGNPVSDLLLDPDGTLHGTTPEYGDAGPDGLDQYSDKGNVFMLTPPAQTGGAYTETTTLSILYETRGTYSRAGLVRGVNDGLYYTTMTFGGAFWKHVVDYGYGAVVSVH